MENELTDEQIQQWCSEIKMCVVCEGIRGTVSPNSIFGECDVWMRSVATDGVLCDGHASAKRRMKGMFSYA